MPRTGCSWRTVSSTDSAWGQQGWGGLGLHPLLGFKKVKAAVLALIKMTRVPFQMYIRGLKAILLIVLSAAAGMVVYGV